MARGRIPNSLRATRRIVPENPGIPVSISAHSPEVRSRMKYTFTMSVRRRYTPPAILWGCIDTSAVGAATDVPYHLAHLFLEGRAFHPPLCGGCRRVSQNDRPRA